jgi:hypothetical protein
MALTPKPAPANNVIHEFIGTSNLSGVVYKAIRRLLGAARAPSDEPQSVALLSSQLPGWYKGSAFNILGGRKCPLVWQYFDKLSALLLQQLWNLTAVNDLGHG